MRQVRVLALTLALASCGSSAPPAQPRPPAPTGGSEGVPGTGGAEGPGGASGSGGAIAEPQDAGPDLPVADRPIADRPRDLPIDTPDPASITTCGFANVVSRAFFDTIFPLATRNPVYSYDGLIEATKAFPTFASTGNLDSCKREAAAFLAHIAHESGFLRQTTERAPTMAYCSSSATCPCDPASTDPARNYHGRGPMQLSWNYNYCSAGTALGLDLLHDPDLVSRDPVITWKTAVWFWMTRGSPTSHAAITASPTGFGLTIKAINGGQDCNMGGYGVGRSVTTRVDLYMDYLRRLGGDPGDPKLLGC
jgi:predicted chitinase